MFANRLSFFYGFKGPSKAVDTACSSAFMALNDAVVDLQRGRVNYAVVGGSSAVFRPATSIAFGRLKMLSPDGACKSFDSRANGYARSEGVAIVILKRADIMDVPWVARKAPYAVIRGIGTNNDGHTEQGITFPSGPAQQELGTEVCRASGVDPADVVYVEAHGTGTVVGDGQELSAIDKLYGQGAGRSPDAPLLIGSVKSNMGHCEGASGMAGLIKLCLAFENGLLPGNLHFQEPNPNNESLINGTLKVVTKPTPWNGGLVAISSFGFGGSNVHCVLEGKVKERAQTPRGLPAPQLLEEGAKPEEKPETAAFEPELIIPVACRTQEGVEALLGELKKHTAEAAALAKPLYRIANLHCAETQKLAFRGTVVNGTTKWEQCSLPKPAPIWFVFSGNGSQWPLMAAPLLKSSKVFRRSVEASAKALAPHKINLMAEFTKEDGWRHPALAMTGLVAVQIGLVDMLREEYGITPAGMLGHSAGEIPCGYADGCMTREQTVLTAYHRGRMAPDHGATGGLMAAVGLSAEAADARLAKTKGLSKTVVGCDNSATGVTLAGPAVELQPLLAALKEEGVFVRELDTLGIAYHSPALEPFSGELHAELKKIFPEPKPRSATWLSTCYPLDSEAPGAKLAGPDYQVQSYKSRVLFTAACAAIPEDAIVLEIGPHSIMRAPLRQNCATLPYVATMTKGQDAELTVREAVAGLWRKGAALAWPADKDTSDLQELPRSIRDKLVSWNHSADYEQPSYESYAGGAGSGMFTKTYDLGGDHKFLVDHNVDGRILMPATSYVVTAWEAYAASKDNKPIAEVPVIFEDVQIHQAVPAEEGQKITLGVIIDLSHHFQVVHSGDLICEGRIVPAKVAAPEPGAEGQEQTQGTVEGQQPAWNHEKLDTVEKDPFYRAIGRTGITYGPEFRMVVCASTDSSAALIRWDQCWIRLLDGMLQCSVADAKDSELRIPVRIRSITINDSRGTNDPEILQNVDLTLGSVANKLATITGLELMAAPRRGAHMTHTTCVDMSYFQPYGVTIAGDDERLTYSSQMMGFYVQRLLPGLENWAGPEEMPPHLHKVRDILRGVKDAGPTPEEMDDFLNHPDHMLARSVHSFTEPGKIDENLKSAMQHIVQHPEHDKMYQRDPACRNFSLLVLRNMVDIIMSNLGPAFKVLEAGSGTGGLTKDCAPLLDNDGNREMLQYVATDVTTVFSANLLESVNCDKLSFQTWDINQPPPEALTGFDAVFASNVIHTGKDIPNVLANINKVLSPGGFLCIYEFTCPLPTVFWGLDKQCWGFTDEREYGLWITLERWERILKNAGFAQVRLHKDENGLGAMLLYRKRSEPGQLDLAVRERSQDAYLEGPRTISTNEAMDEWLTSYRTLLAKSAEAEKTEAPTRLWLTGNEALTPGLVGFARTARVEYQGHNLRMIQTAGATNHAATALPEHLAQLDLTEYVQKDGRWGMVLQSPADDKIQGARLPQEAMPYGAHLQIGQYGDLSTLHWVQNAPITGDDLNCEVTYGALNFKDVMLAYGKLNRDLMAGGFSQGLLGFEFSGVVKGSQRKVMGVAKQAVATNVAAPKHLLWDVPLSWSLKDAATVPVAYLTAYYALIMRGGLTKGNRVLVHSGTGAVGLAAIRICLFRGCEVFTTCSNAKKRAYLLETFPKLKSEHIGDSRSTSFEALVLHKTGGRGVHMALNSLADDKLQATVRCLAINGHLLEIGKYDILKGTPLSMRPLQDNISFQGIDLDTMFKAENTTAVWEMHKLLTDGLQSGEVKPLPWTVFARSRAEDAFRYLAGGTHMGKVLIQISDVEGALTHSGPVPETPKTPKTAKGTPKALPVMAPEGPLSVKPIFVADPKGCYMITGGLGGFGLALADWLAREGATYIVMTSKRGLRNGEQMKAIEKLRARGVTVDLSLLDVAEADECAQLFADTQKERHISGIFHLAMVLEDTIVEKQTGAIWNKCVRPKAVGAINLDKEARRLKGLAHFVCFSSIVAEAGHMGQANYGFANYAVNMLCEQRRNEGLPGLAVQWGPVANVGFVAENLEMLSKASARMFELTVPQPINECLSLLSDALAADPATLQPVVTFHAKAVRGKAEEEEGKSLVETVMSLLGIKPGEIGDNDSLAALGIDSMQVVEVRSRIQRALGRPFPLEEVGTLTLAKVKELEKEAGIKSGKAAPAAQAVQEPEPEVPSLEADVVESTAAAVQPMSAKPGAQLTSANTPRSTLTPTSASAQSTASGSGRDSAGTPISRSSSVSAAADVSTDASMDEPDLEALAQERRWHVLTLCGFLYAGAVLSVVTLPLVTLAYHLAVVLGPLGMLPILPCMWLASGFGLCAAVSVSKRVLMPFIRPGERLPMWSGAFFRWWLVTRLQNLVTSLFAEHLRESKFLVWWYRSLGARIGEGVVLDTHDVSDAEMLTIEDGAVLGEGVTVIGHYFEPGYVCFNRVHIGKNARLEPYSLAQPGTHVPSEKSLPALSTQAESKRDYTGEFKPVESRALSAWATTAAHCGSLWLVGLVLTLAAYAWCWVVLAALHSVGYTAIPISSGPAYALASVLISTGPPTSGVLPIALMTLGFSVSSILGFFCDPTVAGATMLAGPVAYLTYGLVLCMTVALFKWALGGRTPSGIMRRHSVAGARMWLSQRLVDVSLKKFATSILGTWLYNAYLRLLGARIGPYATMRYTNPLLNPDLLDVAEGAHVGDTTYVITTLPLDSDTLLAGTVTYQKQALSGACSVLMPGSVLSQGTTLGARAACQVNTVTKRDMIYVGVPAKPMLKSPVTEDTPQPKGLSMRALYFAWAFLQPAAMVIELCAACYVAALASTGLLAVLGSSLAAQLVAAGFGYISFGATLIACILLAKKVFVGEYKPIEDFRKYSPITFRRLLIMVCDFPFTVYVNDMLRGSGWWSVVGRARGMTVGNNVFVDTSFTWENDLHSFESDCTVARGTVIFCHLGQHRKGELVTFQERTIVGEGALVGARALLLPGGHIAPGAKKAPLSVSMRSM